MDTSKLFRAVLFASSLLAFAGCQTTVDSTSKFYHPVTNQTYPAKPESASIAVLDSAPAGKYTVIGRFKYQKKFTDDDAGAGFQGGHDFMLSAVKHNARLAGADAVIMLGDSESSVSDASNTPAGASKRSQKGQREFAEPAAPQADSGTSASGFTVTRSVDAQMIVFDRPANRP